MTLTLAVRNRAICPVCTAWLQSQSITFIEGVAICGYCGQGVYAHLVARSIVFARTTLTPDCFTVVNGLILCTPNRIRHQQIKDNLSTYALDAIKNDPTYKALASHIHNYADDH